MFWQPHGNPINYKTVKDGQYVEGYIRPSDSWRKIKVKMGRIQLKKGRYSDTDIMLERPMRTPVRIGVIWADGDFRADFGNHYQLYDGVRYVIKKRSIL